MFCKVGLCAPPQLVVALLPGVLKIDFEHIAGIHLCHEVVHFVVLGDCEPMVLAFDLAHVQLAGKSCDVGVGCVASGLEEVRLDGIIFLGCDDVSRLKLLYHCPISLVFVTNVVFFQLFYVLRVDIRNNDINCHGIYQLLKIELLPVDLVFLLELQEIAPLGVVLIFWIREIGPFDAPAFEVLDSGGKAHFGIGGHKREEPVLAAPFVVAKWLANAASWLMRCQMESRVGYPTIASSGTASILPLTILVMVVTVAVIAAMISPFLC